MANNKLKFPAAYIRHFDGRPEKGQTSWYARIDMSCELTPALADALGCPDMMELETAGGVVDVKIPDKFISQAQLGVDGMPNGLECLANSMTDWKYCAHFEDGEIDKRELRFHIRGPLQILQLVMAYVESVHQTPGLLEVVSTGEPADEPIAHQQRIDGGEDPVRAAGPKKRGRPKGSKNRPKTTAEPSASVEA